MSKRLRYNVSYEILTQDIQEGAVLPVKKHSSGGRLSRTHKLRQKSRGSSGLVNHCEPSSERTNPKDCEIVHSGKSFRFL